MKYILIASLLLLTGCPENPSLLKGSGQEVAPPAGYVDYCERHPDTKECGK